MSDTTDQPSVEDRKGYIGGSDLAAILSLSPFADATPFQVFCAKRGHDVPRSADPARDEKFEWGHALEPAIARAFSKRFMIPIRRTEKKFYRHDKAAYMGAHIDFELSDDSRCIVECKNVEFESGWGEPRPLDQDCADLVPLYYLCQVDHYLAVRDAPFGYLVALFGGCKLKAYRIDRDEAREALLMKAEFLFHRRIETDDPPPFSGPDDVIAGLRSQYIDGLDAKRAKAEKAKIPLGQLEVELLKRVARARRAQKKAEKEGDIARSALVERLKGLTGYLYIGKEKVGSLLMGSTETLDDFRLKGEQPELYAKYLRKATYGPVLRITTKEEE